MKTKKLSIGPLMMVKNHLFGKTAETTYTLEDLLIGSSKESLALNKEDRDWLNDDPVGKEVL